MGHHGIAWCRTRKAGDHKWNLEDYLGWLFSTTHNYEASGYHANPRWIEWLLGFPIGYVNWNDWATPSSPRSLSGSDEG